MKLKMKKNTRNKTVTLLIIASLTIINYLRGMELENKEICNEGTCLEPDPFFYLFTKPKPCPPPLNLMPEQPYTDQTECPWKECAYKGNSLEHILTTHLWTHLDLKFTCFICNQPTLLHKQAVYAQKDFSGPYEFFTHMKEVHGNNFHSHEWDSFEKQFLSITFLREHINWNSIKETHLILLYNNH